MITLNQLRYFVAVAEHEHVGKAAEQLNMTQSPLSRQIQDLEARLGLQLFDRVKKRIYLTPAGRNLLNEARALLIHANKFEEKAKAWAEGKIGILEIGYIEGALNCGILPQILHKFRTEDNGVTVRLSPKRSAEQFQALQKREIDIGFTYSAPIPKENFTCNRVFQEGFLLASPASAPPLTFNTAQTLPFIAMPEKMSPQGAAEFISALNTINIYPEIRHEIAEPTGILGLVSAGMGYAVMQESMARQAPDTVSFQKLPDSFPLKMEIYMVTLKEQTELVNAFWKNTSTP